MILCLSIFVSVVLSLAFTTFNPFYEDNIELDRMKNILSITGRDISNMDKNKITDTYENFKEIVIDKDGEIIDSILYSDLFQGDELPSGESIYLFKEERVFPLFLDIDNDILIIPVSGRGLWGTLYGYFAINRNGTVAGITFYKHKETPGLGGEVDAEWFKSQFNSSKNIFNTSGELLSISIKKPGIVTSDDKYAVNGISGATITSNGLDSFLRSDLYNYEKYIRSFSGIIYD